MRNQSIFIVSPLLGIDSKSGKLKIICVGSISWKLRLTYVNSVDQTLLNTKRICKHQYPETSVDVDSGNWNHEFHRYAWNGNCELPMDSAWRLKWDSIFFWRWHVCIFDWYCTCPLVRFNFEIHRDWSWMIFEKKIKIV